MNSVHSRPSRNLLGLLLLLFLIPAASVAAQDAAAHGDAAAPQDLTSDDNPAGLQRELYADEDMAKNASALAFDNQNRVYVAEATRFRQAVEDNRDRKFWLMDDVTNQSVEDRVLMIQKYLTYFEPGYFTRVKDTVVRLEDKNGDGKADVKTIYAEGFDDPEDGPVIGLLHYDDTVYATGIPHVYRMADTDDDGEADKIEEMLSGFGVRYSFSGHDLHGLAIGPLGKLYFSIGDRGYNVHTKEGRDLKDPGAGAVFRCNLDGTDLEVYYYGLRNPQELAFNQYGDLFTVDNNGDMGDRARIVYIQDGGDAGWHMGHQLLTTFPRDIEDGGLGRGTYWMRESLWKPREEGVPLWVSSPVENFSDGPSGLVFTSGTSLPEKYRNSFLLCDYRGSIPNSGVRAFALEQDGAGYRMTWGEKTFFGIAATDVDVGYDGRVYVADFGGGWHVSNQGGVVTLHNPVTIRRPVVEEVRKLFAAGFGGLRTERLLELLSHPDIRVRQRAQFTLAGRETNISPYLEDVVADDANALHARLHALWGLAMRGATATLVAFLSDGTPEIRAQAARSLGEIGAGTTSDSIAELLDDPSARVRGFAVQAVGQLRQAEPGVVMDAVRRNKGSDHFLRQAAVVALSRLGEPEELAAYAGDGEYWVRLAALLALRKQGNPHTARFLADEETSIVNEAIRAINDLNVTEAMDDLADYSQRYTASGSPDAPGFEIFQRLINANHRAGRTEDAVTLARLAGNERLPGDYRVHALRTLGQFANYPTLDPTVAIYRPIPARELDDETRRALAPEIDELLRDSAGEVQALAVEVASDLGIPLDSSLLMAWLRDAEASDAQRLAAMQQLSTRDLDLREILTRYLQSDNAELRAGAVHAWGRRYPRSLHRIARRLIERGGLSDLRAAYSAIAASDTEQSAALLAQQLERVAFDLVSNEAKLDLYLAGQARKEASAVAKQLDQLTSTLTEKGTSHHAFTLSGGDREAGVEIFRTSGTCIRCHRVQSNGGEAGPDLTVIGRERDAEHLLRSVLNPNADIAEGFGITTVVLKSGEALAGTPVEETDERLRLKLATGETRNIAKEEITTRTPTISSMPALGLTLPLSDLRDLMAYLQSLR